MQRQLDPNTMSSAKGLLQRLRSQLERCGVGGIHRRHRQNLPLDKLDPLIEEQAGLRHTIVIVSRPVLNLRVGRGHTMQPRNRDGPVNVHR